MQQSPNTAHHPWSTTRSDLWAHSSWTLLMCPTTAPPNKSKKMEIKILGKLCLIFSFSSHSLFFFHLFISVQFSYLTDFGLFIGRGGQWSKRGCLGLCVLKWSLGAVLERTLYGIRDRIGVAWQWSMIFISLVPSFHVLMYQFVYLIHFSLKPHKII